MKRLLLLFLTGVFGLGLSVKAQDVVLSTFEDGDTRLANQTPWYESGLYDTQPAIMENPYKDGLNESSKCFGMVKKENASWWGAWTYFNLSSPVTITQETKYFKMMVYRSSDCGGTTVGWNSNEEWFETKKAEKYGVWEDVVIDLSDKVGETLNTLVLLHHDWDGQNLPQATLYFDNFVLSSDSLPRTKYAVTVNKPVNGNLAIAYQNLSDEYVEINTCDFENDSEVFNILKGSVLNITINPDSDYELESITPEEVVEKTGMMGDVYYEYTVVGDVTLSAIFKAIQYYSLTVNEPVNGSVAVEYYEKGGWMAGWHDAEWLFDNGLTSGMELRVILTPDEGYAVDYIKNGETDMVADEDDGYYYLTVDNSDIALTVAFKEEVAENPNTAIRIPTKTGSTQYLVRFADTAMGTHTVGNWEDDSRISSFTMSAWIKFNSVAENNHIFGWGQKEFYGADGIFSARISDGKFALRNRAFTKENSTENVATTLVSDINANTEDWFFVTVVYDNVNNKRFLYVNGQLAAESEVGAYGLALIPDEAVLYVGNGDTTLDLDEVQVWNRVLSADEVLKSMYSVDATSEGLLNLYRFDVKNTDNTYTNLVEGVDVPIALVGGTIKNYGWYQSYVADIVEAEQVQGHPQMTEPVAYTVTWASPENGSLVVRNGDNEIVSGAKVTSGTVLTVEAIPSTGYELVSLTAGGSNIMETKSFTVESDMEIVAIFKAKTYSVTVNKPINGNLSIAYINETGDVYIEINTYEFESDSEVFDIPENTILNITVNPDFDYELESIQPEGMEEKTGKNGTPYYEYTVTGDVTISATFKAIQYYSLTLNQPENGTVAVEFYEKEGWMTGWYDASWMLDNGLTSGMELRIILTPDKGYVVDYIRNGETEMVPNEEDGYYYLTVQDSDIEITVGFTEELSSLNSVGSTKVYYDSSEKMLYTGGSAVKVYDISGRLVLVEEKQDVVSVAELAEGIYTAVVNEYVLKFNK